MGRLIETLGLTPTAAMRTGAPPAGADPRAAALAERHARLEPKVAALVARRDPRADNLTKALAQTKANLAAGRWGDAATLLDRLEAIARQAGPVVAAAGPAGGEPPDGDAARPAAGGAAVDAGQGAAAGAADRAAFDKAWAAAKPGIDAAEKIRIDNAAVIAPATLTAYANARKAVDDAVAASDWKAAKAALPALVGAAQALRKALADKTTFEAAYTKHQADIERAMDAVTDKLPLPTALKATLTAAYAALNNPWGNLEWAQANAKLPALVKAAGEMLVAIDKGKKFYAAFAAIKADHDAAWDLIQKVKDDLRTMGRFMLSVTNFARASRAMTAAAGAQKWKEAEAQVPVVHQLALGIVKEKADFDAASKPFQVEYDKLKADLARADAIADAPPLKLKDAEAKTFRTKHTAVIDARDRGDWAAATAGLGELKAAIDALVKADAAMSADKLAFNLELSAVAGYSAALALSAKAPPALVPQAGAFEAANKAMETARFAEDWAAAKAAVPALKVAADNLLKARDSRDGAATPQEVAAIEQQLDALKPRTDKAAEAADSPFVGARQTAVQDGVAAVRRLLAAKKLTDAEQALAGLRADLDAMEKAKTDHAAWRAKYEAARDGAVKKARELKLEPAKLADARTKALDELDLDIVAAAHQGLFPQSLDKVTKWAAEAKAWTASKAAYDNLVGAKPDANKLGALTAQPGGGEVLDALVATLPPDPPQKVMAAALKARYGFSTKHFTKKNKDAGDTSGLKPQGPDTPDKPLKKIYEVLGKVPARNVKGKVQELVQYDQNDGGAMFSPGGKKVYMYCGRPEEAGPDGKKPGEQKFNVPGEVVPAGEEVDESCKPAKDEPLPYFDFALLHEVAHGEDEAKNFMKGKLKNAGFGDWREHEVGTVAKVAADHFGYDLKYIGAMLATKGSKPPKDAPPKPKGKDQGAWDAAREAAVTWCQSVRVDNNLWFNAALSKQVAIAGRVYQECYDDTWVSYAYAARAQGITGYQFRSHWEWFAELYAAYFSKRLRDNHPAANWLKQFDPPKAKP